MKVKIGNMVYDAKDEPIMIILNNGEKEQIANMPKDCNHYCQYPDSEEWTADNYKKIKEWMRHEESPSS